MATRRKDEGESEAGLESRYDDELLSANWNPVIDLLGASCERTREQTGRIEAADDPDAFLKRFYHFGS